MESMVERVSRAIRLSLDETGYYPDAARAAIEAMREPTPEMIEAGNIPGWDDSVSVGLSEEIWPAMIDAALKEEEKVG
jgi:hypothetical protein